MIMQMQAQVLAAYKPTLNTTVLVSHLRGTEQMITKALEWFKSTRHIVLYYEDILTNRKVRQVLLFIVRDSIRNEANFVICCRN